MLVRGDTSGVMAASHLSSGTVLPKLSYTPLQPPRRKQNELIELTKHFNVYIIYDWWAKYNSLCRDTRLNICVYAQN